MLGNRQRLTALLLLFLFALTQCRPSDLEAQEHLRLKRQAVQQRQFIGGLSTLGALIQPILFMIGVANFMGRLPTFFTRVRDRIGNGLSASGAPAGAGRKKRSVGSTDLLVEEIDHAFNTLKEAEQKYKSKS